MGDGTGGGIAAAATGASTVAGGTFAVLELGAVPVANGVLGFVALLPGCSIVEALPGLMAAAETNPAIRHALSVLHCPSSHSFCKATVTWTV